MWSTVTGKIIKQKSMEDEDNEEQKNEKPKNAMLKNLGAGLSTLFNDNKVLIDEGYNRKEIRKDFELYQANSKDQTYMRDWNSFD